MPCKPFYSSESRCESVTCSFGAQLDRTWSTTHKKIPIERFISWKESMQIMWLDKAGWNSTQLKLVLHFSCNGVLLFFGLNILNCLSILIDGLKQARYYVHTHHFWLAQFESLLGPEKNHHIHNACFLGSLRSTSLETEMGMYSENHSLEWASYLFQNKSTEDSAWRYDSLFNQRQGHQIQTLTLRISLVTGNTADGGVFLIGKCERKPWFLCSLCWLTRSASWGSHSGPSAQKDLVVGLKLCYCWALKCFNNFWTSNPALSFCNEHRKLCTQSCLLDLIFWSSAFLLYNGRARSLWRAFGVLLLVGCFLFKNEAVLLLKLIYLYLWTWISYLWMVGYYSCSILILGVRSSPPYGVKTVLQKSLTRKNEARCSQIFWLTLPF